MEKYLPDADEIWHAGDIGTLEVLEKTEAFAPVKAVYGNIDNHKIRSIVPEYNFFVTEGLKILILHIGGYPGRYTPRAKALIRRFRPDVFVSGHSHILKVMQDKENRLLHLNPGAAGKSGFHKLRTMLRFQIDKGTITGLEVIERQR